MLTEGPYHTSSAEKLGLPWCSKLGITSELKEDVIGINSLESFVSFFCLFSQ
jgi:hypothetical protein